MAAILRGKLVLSSPMECAFGQRQVEVKVGRQPYQALRYVL